MRRTFIIEVLLLAGLINGGCASRTDRLIALFSDGLRPINTFAAGATKYHSRVGHWPERAGELRADVRGHDFDANSFDRTFKLEPSDAGLAVIWRDTGKTFVSVIDPPDRHGNIVSGSLPEKIPDSN